MYYFPVMLFIRKVHVLLKHYSQGPVFQNGVRPGVSFNLKIGLNCVSQNGVTLVGTKYTQIPKHLKNGD